MFIAITLGIGTGTQYDTIYRYPMENIIVSNKLSIISYRLIFEKYIKSSKLLLGLLHTQDVCCILAKFPKLTVLNLTKVPENKRVSLKIMFRYCIVQALSISYRIAKRIESANSLTK